MGKGVNSVKINIGNISFLAGEHVYSGQQVEACWRGGLGVGWGEGSAGSPKN